MRTIKFRGYAIGPIVNNQWIYGTGVHHKKNEFFLWSHDAWTQVVAESIGQYTGLVDRNGTEIYEGDIIEYEDFSVGFTRINHPKSRRVIEWVSGEGRYYLAGMVITKGKVDKGEVIGNVYEHPHLLEGVKE